MGMFSKAASFAVDVVKVPLKLLAIPFKVVGAIVAPIAKALVGVTKAIAHTRLGAFLITGAALISAGFGIKHLYEKHQQHRQEQVEAMAPDAGALQQNILQNRQKLAKISAELGQYNNPDPRFREAVRGQSLDGPDFSQLNS